MYQKIYQALARYTAKWQGVPFTGAMAQLPFEGLSQALSQGSLEWVDGLILPGGSQEAAAAGAGTPAHVPAPAEATAAPPTDVLAQGVHDCFVITNLRVLRSLEAVQNGNLSLLAVSHCRILTV